MTNDDPFWKRWEAWRASRYAKSYAKYDRHFAPYRTRRHCRRIGVAIVALLLISGVTGVLVAWDPRLSLVWMVALLGALFGVSALGYITGGGTDGPALHLDEFQLARRRAARSLGLTLSVPLLVIPYVFLIMLVVRSDDDGIEPDHVFAAALLIWWVLCVAKAIPAVLYAWWQTDPDLEDAVDAVFVETNPSTPGDLT